MKLQFCPHKWSALFKTQSPWIIIIFQKDFFPRFSLPRFTFNGHFFLSLRGCEAQFPFLWWFLLVVVAGVGLWKWIEQKNQPPPHSASSTFQLTSIIYLLHLLLFWWISLSRYLEAFFSWDTTNLSMGVGGRYFWCLFFATLFSTASFIHFQGCCSVHMTHMPSITTCEKGI